MTISDLKKGQKAIIKNVNIELLPIKLFELGCLPGSEVQILEKALWNDPIYVNINGTFLAIGKEIAQNIQIERIPSYEK